MEAIATKSMKTAAEGKKMEVKTAAIDFLKSFGQQIREDIVEHSGAIKTTGKLMAAITKSPPGKKTKAPPGNLRRYPSRARDASRTVKAIE